MDQGHVQMQMQLCQVGHEERPDLNTSVRSMSKKVLANVYILIRLLLITEQAADVVSKVFL